uniref:Retrotransposon protein, putative, unclassified, expressed n=1 Tax=Oryza sativa subsp. japonica TaxID=39947 RepID=Q2QUN3_ORYSJ|nr:retrotransposon protein, putative, unclassified, expressed [Oryza sativa Japonica Group]
MPVELLRPVVAAVASLARCVRACAEESNRIEGGSGWCVAAMDGDARVRSGYGARAGPGATTSATTSSSPSYMSIDGDDNGGAGGAKVWVLVLLFLLIVLMFLPSVVRRGRPWGGGGGEHHRGGGGLSLKSGRDVVNLCLVAFAILCGLLGRARRLAASPPSRLERTSSAPYTKGNSLFRKRGGPNHCFECGSIDHLRSHCSKLGRGKREDKDDEKTNDNKQKGTFKGRKIKENLKKAFDQVYAAFEPLSNIDGDSGDEAKGKNISGVCFMACGESYLECENNEVSAFEEAINILSAKKKCEKMYRKQEFIIESLNFEIARLKSLIPNDDDCKSFEVLMNEISNIRDVNVAHDLKNKSSLALSFALHTRTSDELFLTKKLLQKYQIDFHASLMFNMISAKKLKQPHDVLNCSTCNLNKMKLKDALGRVEYMEDVVKNNEVLSCPKYLKSKGVMVYCENCANLEKEVSYLKNSLLRFFDSKKNLNMILDQSKVLVLEVALVARKENMWIVDSGCSRHMTGDKNWFSSLKKASKTKSIIFGDASTSLATGLVKVNENFELKNVALVEDLKYNLLSVLQIVDEDFEVHFKKTGSKVFDSCGDSVLNISRYGRVFKADFDNPVSPVIICLVAKFDKDMMFWHRRLGHVGFDHLTRLSGLDLVRGLPKLKKDLDLVCTPCHHAKMVASSHAPIVSVMTDAPGQLLHMDTVGPARVQSVGGKWYVLVIVDDFSRYSWVLFMATKDEAFQHFRGLFLRLDLEFPGSLKRIRSDNGGLEHEFSSPRVPQQNGVVERKNRVLVEMARTMLDEYKTPRKFWAEAINTACYVSNRVFLRSKLGKTSYELRFGRQLKVSHLRVFGCKCFILKSGNLDKFEARSTDGLFLGYPAHTRGYRVLIMETNKIIETCEVSFDEASPDGPPEITTSTSTDTERGSTSEVAAPLHIQRQHPLEQIIGNIGERTTRSKEEVYVKPLGFENPNFPNHVFKLSKTLYGLKQAPRAWYDRLKNFLLAKGFTMGKILCLLSTLKDYGLTFEKVPLFCDNISATNIAKNHVQHSRTKHIDIRFYFLMDHVEKGDVELQFF